jgi:hypothetical protein
MRLTSGQDDYSSWLLKLGEGLLSNPVVFPVNMLSDEETLISFVFGRSLSSDCPRGFCTSSILTPKNEDTFSMNDKILARQPGTQVHECTSIDSGDRDDPNSNSLFPVEFLNSLTPSGFPPHRLRIKKNTPVILLRNISVENKLTNGTRLLIVEVKTSLLLCEIVERGVPSGKFVMLPRIDFISDGTDTPVRFRRRQFPIRVAFSITINKSQGQTLDRVGLYLPRPCFSHGQLYVALLRVRSSTDVKVCVKNSAASD